VSDRRSAGAAGVAAVGAVLCLLAAAFGAPAMYVPGAALVLLAATAWTAVRLGAWRARVTREPLAASVEEGVAVRLTLSVSGWLPLGGGELSSLPGAAFRPIRRLARTRIELEARPQRRGTHVLGPSTVRFRDPFGICARARLSPSTDVLVLPRVERIRNGDLERIDGLARAARMRCRAQPGTEVEGLRPYRPGAPASRIHWPTVARTGDVLERQLEDETESLPLIVLDARWPASIEALDAAVRAAASLCVALARLGGCSLLLPGAKVAQRLAGDLGAWPALHARLAVVAPEAAPVWSAIDRRRLVLWITGGTRLDARIGRQAGARHYTVSPFPRQQRAVLFTVAGCAVQAAGRAAAARAA
jgi:uncharacterized protein (DUF58 family)